MLLGDFWVARHETIGFCIGFSPSHLRIVLSPPSWLHFRHQTHQNHALALVLATFPTSGSPGANETIGFCIGFSPSHLRIVLSPQSWLHFRHQTHQNHALALVLATFPTSGSPVYRLRLNPLIAVSRLDLHPLIAASRLDLNKLIHTSHLEIHF